MLSHRFRNGWSARFVLAGIMLSVSTLGVLVLSAATAPAGAAAAAPSVVAATAHAGAAATMPSAAGKDSLFEAFSKGNFKGKQTNFSKCGTENLPKHIGSYVFAYGGQTANMCNCPNAGCVVNVTLNGSTSQSTAVGWKSIDIIC
jgi:hypothetical protein